MKKIGLSILPAEIQRTIKADLSKYKFVSHEWAWYFWSTNNKAKAIRFAKNNSDYYLVDMEA